MPNASTPWSTRTVAEGGTDSPVGDLVPVPDEIKPVVNTGFISTSGKYTGLAANDLAFTFQDPEQALAAGAEMNVEGINMLNHDILIVASFDSTGNNVPLSFAFNNAIAGLTSSSPYLAGPFQATGVREPVIWKVNEYPGSGGTSGALDEILYSGTVTQYDAWGFFKVIGLRGTVGKLLIANTHGSNAGAISTAYLRIV
jgi:hypothetical protein